MTIASRTPEGEPLRCPVCRKVDRLEPSFPGGDSCCPSCGQWLLHVRDKVRGARGAAPAEFLLATSIADLGVDSLDVVELVMELEEELDIDIPDDVAERSQTVGDVLRHILGVRDDRPEDDSGEPN